MIRNAPSTVKCRLVNLYNSILNSSIPQTFKYSLILPILKPKSDKCVPESYRPISLNLCMAKILDKIVANRLWWFVTNSKLLDSRQMGFRSGKSTAHSLLLIDYLAANSLSCRNHLTIISLDFQKAYDKIGLHTSS